MNQARLFASRSGEEARFVEELPRSAIGKVLKKDIRARYWHGRERQI